jgi:outer membrane receptor protein involved in Fe transport
MFMRIRFGVTRSLNAAFVALFMSSAWAEESPPPSPPESVLEPIIVTTTRRERTLADQPDSVSVLTRDQIERVPAQSLDDVLRTIPSVNLPFTASYQVHPTANSVSMRGLGGIRALVLLDGVPLNDPFFGYIQWNRVPMENVERVEVLRGGGSPLWGNYAMGGVINIITRVPETQEFGLSGGYGSYNTYRTDAYADLVPWEPFKIRANFNAWGTSGFNQVPPEIRTSLEVPTTFHALNGELATYFRPDSTLRGYVSVNVHENDQTLITPGQTNHQQNVDVAGSVTKTLGSSELTLTAYYGHGDFVTNNTEAPFGAEPFTAEFLQNRHTTLVDSGGLSVFWSTRLNDVFRLLSVGVDFQEISGTDTAQIFDESGTQIRTDIGQGKQLFAGLFGQASVFPIKALEILASGRLQYFRNFDGFNGIPGGLGDVPATDEVSFNPRVSLRYQLIPQFALRLAGYTAFRAPNLDNLYRAFSTSSGIFLPNAQLKPEKLKGAEGGFDVTWGPIRSQVTAYGARVTDLITSRNLTEAELPPKFFFGTENINAGAADAYGVEATLDWQIVPGLTANVGYAYANSRIVENDVDPLSVGNQQAGIPPHQVTAGLSYAHPIGFRVSTRMRWVAKSFGDNDHTLPIDSHAVVDLSLGYQVMKYLELYVDIQNLFNNQYIADNSGFNPPLRGTPITAFGGLRAKY